MIISSEINSLFSRLHYMNIGFTQLLDEMEFGAPMGRENTFPSGEGISTVLLLLQIPIYRLAELTR